MTDPRDAPDIATPPAGAPSESAAPRATRDEFAAEIALWGWEIGAHSYGRPTIVEPDLGGLRIGRYCSIGPNVTIVLGNHRTDLVTTYPFGALASLSGSWPEAAGLTDHEARGVTVIGSDVWIAANATILSGVEIGSGAVIGAGALVTRPVPPYAVVAGNPARIIRTRFPPAAIARLLRVAWWDWPDARVRQAMPLLMDVDIEAFLAQAEAALPRATETGRARKGAARRRGDATNERRQSSRAPTVPIAPGTGAPDDPIPRDAGERAGDEGETGS